MPPRTTTPRRRASSPSPRRTVKAGATRTTKQSRPKITVEDLASFNESINILVYGDSGVGKTPFSSMAPRCVILSTEKGSISAKRFGSTAKLIRAFDWVHVEAALDYLEEHPDEFDWLCLDSLTKMQFLLLRHLLGINVEENRKNADIDLPQLQDHQKWQNMFKRFVDRIIDMPINTVFIATAMHKEDAEGEDIVLPDVQGKDYAIAQYVCAQMDGVYCLKVASPKKDGEPFWRLLTQTKPPYFAKDRYRALPRVINYPYMPKVIELIENSISHGKPLYGPERMTVSDAPNGVGKVNTDDFESLDDDDEFLEDDEDDPGADVEPAKPHRGRGPGSAPARRRKAAKRLVRERLEAEGKEDEEEDEPKPPKRTVKRRAGNRRPAKRPEPEPELEEDEDEDEDDFDPDDIDLEDE